MITPEEKLDQLDAHLERLIKASPRNSRTARAAREQLDFLSSPSCWLSIPEKVREIRDTIRRYQWGLNADHSRHGPNSGPEANPLRPQKP